MENEELLDELHIQLADVCIARKWGLIQRSVNADNTRMFLLWTGNKRVKVALTNEKIVADGVIRFDYSKGVLSKEHIAQVISQAFDRG
jgi:hypothetical protein